MSALTRSFIALVLLVLPSSASACMPGDPYDYPIRGAYLGIFFTGVMMMTLELLRLRAASVAMKRGLRLASFGFGLVLIISLLLACTLTTFRANWLDSLPELPAGAAKLRC